MDQQKKFENQINNYQTRLEEKKIQKHQRKIKSINAAKHREFESIIILTINNAKEDADQAIKRMCTDAKKQSIILPLQDDLGINSDKNYRLCEIYQNQFKQTASENIINLKFKTGFKKSRPYSCNLCWIDMSIDKKYWPFTLF